MAALPAHNADLWTQDTHFDGLPGVRYFSKTRRAARVPWYSASSNTE